ncbi:MAG: hypothetical protein ACXWB1_00575, partial [Kaistella sp.]
MTKYILFPIIAFSMFSCKQNSDKLETENSSGDSQQLETCYQAVQGKDSVKLSIIISAGNITGSLLYHNTESTKSSSGTFTGAKSGDTLKLLSRFANNGTINYNEIYLLNKSGKLYEGIGEVEKINDSTTVFAEPSKIDFNKSFIFDKVEC